MLQSVKWKCQKHSTAYNFTADNSVVFSPSFSLTTDAVEREIRTDTRRQDHRNQKHRQYLANGDH